MTRIYINGDLREIAAGLTLDQLLTHLKVRPASVVTEHNEKVILPPERSGCLLQEEDRVEIVHFVGGGSSLDQPSASEPEPASAEPEASQKKSAKAAKKPAAKKKSKAVKKTAADETEPAKAKPRRRGGARYLVIVESPAKAKTINKFLGSDYKVEASYGHVRDLPKSKMGIDIEHGFEPHYIIMRKAQKNVTRLKKEARYVEGIFLAPDPDREGEAISWHLAHIFREDDPAKPISRVVFNEITKEAVQESFRNPRGIEMHLVDAQQARRVLDRVVGYQLSPLLWKKVGRGLSAGRVQSVALRLIVEREREIRKFVPDEYWTMDARLSSKRPAEAKKIFTAKLDRIDNQKADLKNGKDSEEIRQELLKQTFQVADVDKSERRRKPQAPYTTSKLQQEAFSRLGFSAIKTMRTAQKLYEGVDLGGEGTVGLITYMRTDSVYIAESARKEAADFIMERYGRDFMPDKPPVYKAKKGAQEAHEAVRPSSAFREPDKIRAFLSDEEYKLYALIWKKFMASQMSSAVDEQLTVTIQAGTRFLLKTTGRRNLFPGFSVLYLETKPENEGSENAAEGPGLETDKEAVLAEMPELEKGEILHLHEMLAEQHFTKPPARFNDASFVKILEEKGIGRPSTYAPTLFTLLGRDYVQRQSSALIPTEFGETVVDLLIEHFPQVMDVQ
nr:type I DNA topoisomerase [Candidatus Omnitrophota bacterium]